jgi:hypothetical protein
MVRKIVDSVIGHAKEAREEVVVERVWHPLVRGLPIPPIKYAGQPIQPITLARRLDANFLSDVVLGRVIVVRCAWVARRRIHGRWKSVEDGEERRVEAAQIIHALFFTLLKIPTQSRLLQAFRVFMNSCG